MPDLKVQSQLGQPSSNFREQIYKVYEAVNNMMSCDKRHLIISMTGDGRLCVLKRSRQVCGLCAAFSGTRDPSHGIIVNDTSQLGDP